MNIHDYVVGREHGHTFRVTKFGRSSWPVEVYYVAQHFTNYPSQFYLTCTCPGGLHPDCKHRRMVRAFLEFDCPILNHFWQDDKGELHASYQNVTPEWRKELESPGSGKKKIRRKK